MKMTQTSKPAVSDSLEVSSKNLKLAETSTLSNRMNSSLMTKEEKLFPLEIKDVKQIPKEKIISARIGVESDSYLHHAVKCKRLDLL